MSRRPVDDWSSGTLSAYRLVGRIQVGSFPAFARTPVSPRGGRWWLTPSMPSSLPCPGSSLPTQHSSGGHARLGEISCRGDAYLRTLLVLGARSSLQRAKAVATEKATPEQRWIRSLDGRMPFGKVIVAIANKHARQIWAMLAHGVDYDPCACLQHPMHRQTHTH